VLREGTHTPATRKIWCSALFCFRVPCPNPVRPGRHRISPQVPLWKCQNRKALHCAVSGPFRAHSPPAPRTSRTSNLARGCSSRVQPRDLISHCCSPESNGIFDWREFPSVPAFFNVVPAPPWGRAVGNGLAPPRAWISPARPQEEEKRRDLTAICDDFLFASSERCSTGVSQRTLR